VTAGAHGLFRQLTLADTTVDPGLKDGMYAFYLQAQGPQKAALKDYFAVKGWPSEFLAQIKTEITGGSPNTALVMGRSGQSSADSADRGVRHQNVTKGHFRGPNQAPQQTRFEPESPANSSNAGGGTEPGLGPG
jgi:hypothetical protein